MKKIEFQPYTQIKTFLKQYKRNAEEYLKGTEYTTFPKHLFVYITRPKKKIKESEISTVVNKINDSSVKGKWGEYRNKSLADQEAYFT